MLWSFNGLVRKEPMFAICQGRRSCLPHKHHGLQKQRVTAGLQQNLSEASHRFDLINLEGVHDSIGGNEGHQNAGKGNEIDHLSLRHHKSFNWVGDEVTGG